MKSFIVLCFGLASFFGIAIERVDIPRSQRIELKDEATQRVYPIYIKLPRTYNKNSKQTYPVIYMTDGMYSFQIASGTTRYTMNSGAMKEAILVSIGYSKGSRGPSSRVRDYTPSKDKSWKLTTGQSELHLKFIEKTVINYVDANYRTMPNTRTLVGNSLGGLFTSYALLMRSDMFSSYIIGSPSVWYNDEYILGVSSSASIANKKVYIAVGSLEKPQYGLEHDMVAGATQLADKLGKEIPATNIKLHIIDGAKHETAFATTLIQGLDWLYAK